jgi:hypothetical protein
VNSENRACLSRMTWTNVLNHEALDRGVDVPRRHVLGSPSKWYDINVLEASRAFSMLQWGCFGQMDICKDWYHAISTGVDSATRSRVQRGSLVSC